MKLLVTGGAGFIGSNFIRHSLESYEGLKLTVLDALTYAADLSNLEGIVDKITLVRGDIRNQQLVEELTQANDLIVNFAAETHNDNSLRSPELFIDVNVIGTLNLIQAALKFDKRFHQISTDEVFGDLPINSEEKFNSSSPYRPSSPYSASKASADHLVRAWIRSFNLEATISNCTNNYGKFQHGEKLIPKSIEFALKGKKPELFGSGLNVRDWIHVIDHVEGIWAVLNKGKTGQTYLFGGAQPLSNLDVVRFVLDELGLAEDYIDFIEDRSGHDERYSLDISHAYESLGWAPKSESLSQYMPTLIDFYKSRQ